MIVPMPPQPVSVPTMIYTTQLMSYNISRGEVKSLKTYFSINSIRELNGHLESLIEQIKEMSQENAQGLLNAIASLEPNFKENLQWCRSNPLPRDASEFDIEFFTLKENLADVWLELQVSADPDSLNDDDMEEVIDYLVDAYQPAPGTRTGSNY